MSPMTSHPWRDGYPRAPPAALSHGRQAVVGRPWQDPMGKDQEPATVGMVQIIHPVKGEMAEHLLG